MGWKPGSSPSWACSPSTWWGVGQRTLDPVPWDLLLPERRVEGSGRALAGWGNLRHQVQEGVTGERAHSHAQEDLDDVVGRGATSGTAEEHEPEEGAQAGQQRGQGAVQVPWTGRTVSASLPTVAPCFPGRGVQIESGRSRSPLPRLQPVGCSPGLGFLLAPGLKPPSSSLAVPPSLLPLHPTAWSASPGPGSLQPSG